MGLYMKISKLLAFAVIAINIFFMNGCWDYVEFDDLVQVNALGIDYNEKTKRVNVTIQHISTEKKSSGGEGASPSSSQGITHAASADSVLEAMAKLQQVIIKKMFFGYLDLIVVNEGASYFIGSWYEHWRSNGIELRISIAL